MRRVTLLRPDLALAGLVLVLSAACDGSPTDPCPGPFALTDPGIIAPQRLEAPAPGYTEEARRARIQGVVIAEGVVSCQGRFESLRIVKGLGLGLDQSTLETLVRWRFTPATRDGSPVSVLYQVTIEFRLR